LPPELLIPGVRRINFDVSRKSQKEQRVRMEDEVLGAVKVLGRKYSCGLFEVLQAAFIDFFAQWSGIRDICFGTDIFGRDFPEMEDQIGCYAKMALIRVLLDADDSFDAVIEKVKRAGEAMREKRACGLMEYLQVMLPNDKKWSAYWNINFQYIDSSYEYFQPLDLSGLFAEMGLKVELRPGRKNSLIGNDLMFSFTYSGDMMELTVSYDSSLYTAVMVKDLVSNYFFYILSIFYK
jgi:hypothetical protein